jgi:hypothetical protein
MDFDGSELVHDALTNRRHHNYVWGAESMTYRRRSARYETAALIMIIIIALGGCTRRPGPSVLEPIPSVGAAKVVNVFVASTRAAQPEAQVPLAEGGAAMPANFRYVISIPPTHRPTEIEWPINAPDPARYFSVISAERLNDQERASLSVSGVLSRLNSATPRSPRISC